MTRRFVITGRVQGVGYRDWFVAQARAHDATGWVRNRTNGSVEALVEAPSDILDRLAVTARQGPSAARVADVAVTDAAATTAPFTGFTRYPTQ
jgi:acylphosphatase